ncbi:PREDICTED: zinc finger protein 585B-like [Priapulus caudatus]|uniref:Zinc finger protein 585B-like n=1 Tax=Priapulus caudatus TaxID=37621 RepID=A0ABM1F4F4_PRICU|nr:PREDICTED: zinc finger protein 585B-like [Priapulus caudatus]XP_014679307.1 PREDICTED: zinc finger protein 585B-like [Priapulus caudatus]XP_014679313.1 PREDICTED: zinc finger protein 585B-like [Priapulus caudatus]XP_014679318.1 PREDICTED: zinc finger protein 585B-like [Priapulus caudatus]XP_014679325.1 PREDICTED: zinc finger protein 585B-like [Priapulus caudatus]
MEISITSSEMETEVVDGLVISGCDVCGADHPTEACPELALCSADTKLHQSAQSRARLTLPKHLEIVDCPDGTTGILAVENISAKAQFGPFEAKRVLYANEEEGFQLKVLSKDGSGVLLDTTDEHQCNWMCLVRPADSVEIQNMIAYQLGSEIFFTATKEIEEGQELRVWYAPAYARKLKKPIHPVEVFSAVEASVALQVDEQLEQNDVSDSVNPEKITLVAECKCGWCGLSFVDTGDLAKHLMGHFTGETGSTASLGKKMRKTAEVACRKKDGVRITANKKTKLEPGRKRNNRKVKTSAKHGKHHCEECQEYFRTKGQLTKHRREHKQLLCKHCGECFQSMAVLRPHMRKHTYDSNQRQCSLCGKVVPRYQYNSHVSMCTHGQHSEASVSGKLKPVVLLETLTPGHFLSAGLRVKNEPIEQLEDSDHSSENMEECAVSEVAFNEDNNVVENAVVTNEDSLSDNEADDVSPANGNLTLDSMEEADKSMDVVSQNSQNLSKIFECKICKKSFTRKTSLSRHMALHEGRFQCQICDRKFSRRDILDDHVCINLGKSQQAKCDICGRIFNNMMELYRHLQTHLSSHHCSKCQRKFSTVKELESHACSYSECQYFCKLCYKAFNTQKLLDRHSNKHKGRFICNLCNKTYTSKSSLENHSCAVTPRDKVFGCDICEKKFAKEKYLTKHLPLHTGEFACEICKKWLSGKECLFNHMRFCSKVQEIETFGVIECSKCKLEYTDVPSYRQHQMTHTHVHVCSKCGCRFPKRSRLEMHICAEIAPKCQTCGKVFKSVSNLNKHMEIHNDPKYECMHCGTHFHRRDNMMAHVCKGADGIVKLRKQIDKEVHFETLVCEVCGTQFNSRSNLNQHRLLHGQKNFVCDECGKKFHRKDALKDHSMVHSAECKFQCVECGKMVKSRHSLIMHMRLHEEEKQYSCDVCGKFFSQKGNMLKHRNTHIDGIKFPCSYCGKSFGSKEYLAIHVLEHTQTVRFICEVCNKPFVKKHLLKQHEKILHSNLTLTCEFCPTTVKLRHSLRRHLRKKHADLRYEWDKTGYIEQLIKNKQQDGVVETLMSLNQLQGADTGSLQNASNEQVRQIFISGDISDTGVIQHIEIPPAQDLEEIHLTEEQIPVENNEGVVDENDLHRIVATNNESKSTLQQLVQIPGFIEAIESVQRQDPNTVITFEVLKE